MTSQAWSMYIVPLPSMFLSLVRGWSLRFDSPWVWDLWEHKKKKKKQFSLSIVTKKIMSIFKFNQGSHVKEKNKLLHVTNILNIFHTTNLNLQATTDLGSAIFASNWNCNRHQSSWQPHRHAVCTYHGLYCTLRHIQDSTVLLTFILVEFWTIQECDQLIN